MSLARRIPAAPVVLPGGALAAGVTLWWAVTAIVAVPSFLLPTPGAVAARLVDAPTLYLENALITLERVAIGGTAGVAAGVGIGILVATVPLARRALYPYLVALRVLPKIALAPLLLVYFGVGFHTAVLFVALVAFFPAVVSTAAGLERTPDRHRDLLRSVDAPRWRAFLRVRLVYALPDLLAGVKQSTTLAVVGAVVAEWVVATDGLGYLVLVASENVQVDAMLAALVLLIGLGLSLFGAVVAVGSVLDRRWGLPG